jgi:uncharacterized protein
MQTQSKKKTYPPGVPCWVEALEPDPRAALAFYHALFGWEGTGPGPMPGGGEYSVARLHGDDVAGVATLPPGGIAEPAWTTYVSVDRLDAAVRRVVDAGGHVIVAQLNAPPAGRLAIVESPTGASFGLWEAGDRDGAQRVNEPGAWAMSSLRTRNLNDALPFYTTVFGWNVQPFDAGGAQAALLRLPGYVGGRAQQPVPRDVVAVALEDAHVEVEHWFVDFWIDDIDSTVERAVHHGGTVIKSPFAAANSRRAVIASPGGVIFKISQLR